MAKNRFFFFPAPPGYGVWRPNNFSTPLKTISAPKNFFSAACFFRRPKPKIVFFGGRLRSNIFRRPSGKTSFFFFFRRRLVMVFGGQITFSTPPKTIRPPKSFFGPKNVFRRLCFFSALRKTAVFGQRALKEQSERPSLHLIIPYRNKTSLGLVFSPTVRLDSQ